MRHMGPEMMVMKEGAYVRRFLGTGGRAGPITGPPGSTRVRGGGGGAGEGRVWGEAPTVVFTGKNEQARGTSPAH